MSRHGGRGGGMGGRRHIQLGNGHPGQHLRRCHHGRRDYTDEGSDYTDDEGSDYIDDDESEYGDEEPERRGGRRGGQGRQENYFVGQRGGYGEPERYGGQRGGHGRLPPYEGQQGGDGGPPRYGRQRGGYGGPEQYGYAPRYRGVNHLLAAELARLIRNGEERAARMQALAAQIQARRQDLDAPRAHDAERAQEDEDLGHGRQEDNEDDDEAYVQWLAQRITKLEARLTRPKPNYRHRRQEDNEPEEDNAPEEHNVPPMPPGWGVDDSQWTPEQLAHMAEVTQRMRERGVPGW